MRPAGSKSFGEVELMPLPEGEVQRYPGAGMQSLLNQFEAAIRGSATPETNGADNLWTLAMFQAASQSTRSGQTVSIDSVYPLELQARAGAVSGR